MREMRESRYQRLTALMPKTTEEKITFSQGASQKIVTRSAEIGDFIISAERGDTRTMRLSDCGVIQRGQWSEWAEGQWAVDIRFRGVGISPEALNAMDGMIAAEMDRQIEAEENRQSAEYTRQCRAKLQTEEERTTSVAAEVAAVKTALGG